MPGKAFTDSGDSSGKFDGKQASVSPRVRKLLRLIQELHSFLDTEFQQKWNRSLPFADYLVDRWQRANDLGFGEGTSIYDSSLVLGDVSVGRKTWIVPFTILDGSGGLEIGEFCSISAGVQIYTHDTVSWATSGGERQVEREKVTIGNRCYIGPNTIISRGVVIGDGCVIGAQSFVNRNIPGGTKAWGSPAKIQGKA